MVAVSLSGSAPTNIAADALVLGLRPGDDAGPFSDLLAAMGFTAEKNQVVTAPAGDLATAPLVVAVALPASPSGDDLRRAAARAVRAARQAKASALALALTPEDVGQIGAIVEGIQLADYGFAAYRTVEPSGRARRRQPAPREGLESAVVLTSMARQKAAIKTVETATVIAGAVNAARDWVNTPAADKRPPDFAEAISATAAAGVRVTVWDEAKLRRERCGGLLSVAAGSEVAPRLVRLRYAPEDATRHLALVGKGITFDSGGLSLKPATSMATMKMDMAGAAAVVAAINAIATLRLPVTVTAYACLAENMPSGSATRPGDVLTMRDGRTVEVTNTDAEGRLVLADGLTLAAESDADRIVDVATLTGACVVALGTTTAGVMGNDDVFVDAVVDAARSAGELVWPLPITDEVIEKVTTSTMADLRQHNPASAGGSLFAAAFLREFVGSSTWAHLDIAGPAYREGSASDETPEGGTGFGVRTLVRLAADLAGQPDARPGG